MKLFTTGKTPLYCEAINHRLEKRKSGDTKVVDLVLVLDPFTTQHASALHAEYGFIKRLLFKQTDATPTQDLKACTFAVPGERQLLSCFATPDSPSPSIALDQVKVTGMRVRSPKDGNRWVLVMKVTFGPLGRTELEYVNAWYTEQRFVSFEQADPSLFEDGVIEDEDVVDGDEDEAPAQTSGPKAPADPPMFADPRDVPATDGEAQHAGKARTAKPAEEPVRQRLKSHAGGKAKGGRGAAADVH